jgi:hypothetical protein
MAKPRSKKHQRPSLYKPPLPGVRPPGFPGTARVLPMQLQIGDRMTDSSGEWWGVRKHHRRRQELSRSRPAGG